MTLTYPVDSHERTQWILQRRGERNPVSLEKPYAFFVERERNAEGRLVDVATLLLTSRECPWKCLMCDLWRNTVPQRTGTTAAQIAYALARLPSTSAIKLYNSGSFFDRAAISQEEWPAIAQLLRPFENVVVECHPKLVTEEVLRFAEMLPGRLEVALGLETCHPEALAALNKRISVADFESAAILLTANGISLRTFLLVHPPFIERAEQQNWLSRSIGVAFDVGSAVVSLIPLRHGNGAIELFAEEPALSELETGQETGVSMNLGRVFADTWDLARFCRCSICASARSERITRINQTQMLEPRIICKSCGR